MFDIFRSHHLHIDCQCSLFWRPPGPPGVPAGPGAPLRPPGRAYRPAPRACQPAGPPGVPTGRRKWPFAKFANFEIRRFSANGFRYSKVFKSELETKEYCDFLVLCISLKLFFHGFYHESQNLQISQFANFSRMV